MPPPVTDVRGQQLLTGQLAKCPIHHHWYVMDMLTNSSRYKIVLSSLPDGLKTLISGWKFSLVTNYCDQTGAWSRRKLNIRHMVMSEIASAGMGTQLESSCFSDLSPPFHFIMSYIYPFHLLIFHEDK